MFEIDRKTNAITLTRGDTMVLKIDLTDAEGDKYIPGAGDTIRFAMKKNYEDETPVVTQDAVIDGEDIIITVPSNATKPLEFGGYKYDIQLTTGSGVVDTFIGGVIRIAEEVD